MIRYSRDSVLTVIYWWGGIIRHLWYPAFIYSVYLVGSYYTTMWFDFEMEMERNSVRALGGFVMFLFVFRMNQCMARHCKGNELSAALFSDLEFFVQTFCTCTRGTNECILDVAQEVDAGEEEMIRAQRICFAELAIVSKINCVRLTVALGLSCVAHLWLLDAAASTMGEIHGEELAHCMFIFVRLEGLLYPEELKLIDEALCITKEMPGGDADSQPDSAYEVPPHRKTRSRATRWIQAFSNCCEEEPEPLFRAEVNRHRLNASVQGERLVGPHLFNGEMSVVPMPKIISQLLMDAVLQSSDLKWSYQQRIANFFVSTCAGVANKMEELNRLVSQPLPLAYKQHCRCLLVLYALFFPLSVAYEDGFLENVAMPLLIFTTLYGFEVLASEMENPLGLEEMDLNMLDMVHSLEVSAESAFNISEAGKKSSRMALRRPLQEFGMLAKGGMDLEEWHDEVPVGRFSHYFGWQPIPTLILASMATSHGHVDTVHQAYFYGISIRRLLRRSLLRRKQHGGSIYTQLNGVGESPASSSDHQSDDMLGDLRRDPMLWCHYLSLRRHPPDARDSRCAESRETRRPWSAKMEMMLQGTTAGEIFTGCENEDAAEDATERSMLEGTPRPQAMYLDDCGPRCSEERYARRMSYDELLAKRRHSVPVHSQDHSHHHHDCGGDDDDDP